MTTVWYLVLVLSGGGGAVASSAIPVISKEICETTGESLVGKEAHKTSYKEVDGFYCIEGVLQ